MRPEAGKFGDNVVVHIALVVRDIDKAARAYANLLGVEVPQVSITDALENSPAFSRKADPGAGQTGFPAPRTSPSS
ncbi:MAG: hypothetical protein WKF30_11130 [Pyrinomonadaceae bacterium]